jgi:hypothetical protein
MSKIKIDGNDCMGGDLHWPVDTFMSASTERGWPEGKNWVTAEVPKSIGGEGAGRAFWETLWDGKVGGENRLLLMLICTNGRGF